MNKDVAKKIVVFGMALVLVLVILIPSVDSQFSAIFNASSVQKEHIKNGSRESVNNLDSNSVFESKLKTEEATYTLPLETGNWWNDSWLYRKNITIDHTKVDDDFVNFPVLISLPSDGDLASNAQNNGSDIVFVDYSGNKLNHEIELFNGSTGELVAWVNVTSLSSTVNTTLCMYYGNPSAANQENPSGVWHSSYKLVQHLNETTGTHYDSTIYDNDGTPQNGVNQNAVGKIDGADEFDGSDDYVEVLDDDSLHQSNAISVEVWGKADTFGVWRSIAAKDKSGTSEWWFGYTTQNKLDFKFNGQTGFNINANTVITDSDWHHLVGVYNGSHIYVYVDGALDSTPLSYNDINSNTGSVNIGYTKYWNCCRFNGTIDEVRISNIARDGSWISTSYNNQNDPNTFYSIGDEEDVNKPPNTPSDPDPYDGETGVDVDYNLGWTGGDPDPGDTVTYDVYFGTNSSSLPIVSNNQSASTYDPGTMSYDQTYYWKIVSWDNHGAFTEGPIWWFSTVANQPPSKPIILSAPTFGKPETQLDFSTVAIDPEGDDVYYMWDWGDGSYSNWLGPFGSGQTTEANHKWDETGEFEVKVKAKDSNDAESYWSEPVQLIIENEPPDMEITQPIPNAIYFFKIKLRIPFITTLIVGPIDITVSASDNISGMDRVEFYLKDSLKETDASAPYVWPWRGLVFRLERFEIKVIAYDNAGNRATDTITGWKFL